MCRNSATFSYFMILQMAMFCLTSSGESQKVLCRYGKYVNLDNILSKIISIIKSSFLTEKWQSTTFMPILGHQITWKIY